MKSSLLTYALAFVVGTAMLSISSCSEEEPEEEMGMSDDMNDTGSDMSGGDTDSGDGGDTGSGDGGSGAVGNAPAFTLESVGGNNVSLSDLTGSKPVVIFFFGNSCPLCKASAPSVESKINAAFKSQINMIGIDTWDGNKSSVQNFASSTGVTFDLLLKGSSVQSNYNTTYDRLFCD